MQQLHLQLYAKTKTKDFDERVSTFRTVTLGVEPQVVEISLESPPEQELVEVRIDPDDRPSSFVLHYLRIRSLDGTELYNWDGEVGSLKQLVDLAATETADGVVLESTSQDPFFVIPLAKAESRGLILELSVSQRLISAPNHEELAEAVRMLQSSLRFSLDDLAEQQAAFQEALTVHQAHSRREIAALEGPMRQLALGAEHAREQIFSEVREDWRAVRRHVVQVGESGVRQNGEQVTQATADVIGEIALLRQSIHRIAGAVDIVNDSRAELGVCGDEEVIGAIRRLIAETEENRRHVQALERSLCWRLTKPFRSILAIFKDPRKP